VPQTLTAILPPALYTTRVVVRKSTGISCQINGLQMSGSQPFGTLGKAHPAMCVGLQTASEMSLHFFIAPRFAAPIYPLGQSSARTCVKSRIHKQITVNFTDLQRMEGSLILLRSHSLRVKLKDPWGKREKLLFA